MGMKKYTLPRCFCRSFAVFFADGIRMIVIAALWVCVLIGVLVFSMAYIDSNRKNSLEKDFDFKNAKVVVLCIDGMKYDVSHDGEFLSLPPCENVSVHGFPVNGFRTIDHS
jgi:hypothetical protein